MDLVDFILPRRRVHLLGGVSDAGKTRFILPAMVDFAEGKPFLGRPSHPVPWAYVSGDRSLEEVHDTLGSLGISREKVPIIPAFGKDNKHTFSIINAASKMTPVPQLLVIEGFSDLPTGDFRKNIREFLSNCSAYCAPSKEFPEGLTILGIVESPKLKPAERYPNPRQRISGVSSWSYHTSTILLIENIEGDPAYESAERVIWVCSKGALRRKLAARFDGAGRLRLLTT